MQFLAGIKQTRNAGIIQAERDLLKQMADLGLLDEVINVVILLTFNKVDSANLNEKYAMKVANDYSYNKVRSAEEAVLRNQREESKGARTKNQRSQSQVQKAMSQNGVIQNIKMKPAKKLAWS